MKNKPNVPRVAFVVDLGPAGPNDRDAARTHHLVHLFHGHRLPATWAVNDAEQAIQLHGRESSPSYAKQDVALRLASTWCDQITQVQFRRELNSRIAELNSAVCAATHLVAGNPGLLRSRAAILAEQGIGGVLALPSKRSAVAKPRPLPCGLWQFDPSVHIPLEGGFLPWLFGRRTSANQLIAAGASGETVFVSVESSDLGRVSARSLQSFEKLLREVSWAASRNQLVVSTVDQALTELIAHRAVKPQRSILRLAA